MDIRVGRATKEELRGRVNGEHIDGLEVGLRAC